MRIDISTNHRAFVYVNKQPEIFLGPGRHWVWRPLSQIDVRRVGTDKLLADLTPEEFALVPARDIRVVEVNAGQRAVVSRRGRAVLWLGVGTHLVWTVSEEGDLDAVDNKMIDTSAIAAPVPSDDLRAVMDSRDFTEVTAPENSVALRFVDGVLEASLPAGRHAAWTTEREVKFTVIDLRERVLEVTGQEVMTKDRVSLRLNASAAYRVADPEKIARVAQKPDGAVYLAIQFALRREVASRTLDGLLADREALGRAMMAEVAQRSADVGIEVTSLGIKDVILPGEMKTLLNRVIEAQKEAEANVILRREETAAVRSMANTAKVLADNPVLVRLKELEAYKELAASVGEVSIIMGDGVMPKLMLK